MSESDLDENLSCVFVSKTTNHCQARNSAPICVGLHYFLNATATLPGSVVIRIRTLNCRHSTWPIINSIRSAIARVSNGLQALT